MNKKKATSKRFCVGLIIIAALVTRAYNIIMPSSIVYDEMYTFKYAKAYLTNLFAFDVHPPLTKMIIAYIMSLLGFDNNIICEIGESLEAFYPGYIVLRFISVLLFIFCLLMTHSMLSGIRTNRIAMLISLFLVFEVAFHVHYGMIMQDTYVFFYQTTMLFSCVKYQTQRKIKWVYLFGISFALAISSKHSAIFTALPIIIWFLIDLFYQACDGQNSLVLSWNSCLIHAIHRIAAIGLIPLFVYVTSFYIHFKFQRIYSDDLQDFSLQFQSQFTDNYLEESDIFVIDRSIITLINKETKSYVKSEHKNYASGSQQQVVFADDEKNEKSIWKFVKIHIEDSENAKEKDMFLQNEDHIKLVHMLTDRYLHSHHINAPTHYEKKFKEVSCYGGFKREVTDDNDYWIVKSDTQYVMARESIVKLFHVKTGTYLGVNSNSIEGRHEVYSSMDGAHKFRDFYVEDNKIDDYYYENLPDPRVKDKISGYKPMSFFGMFTEYHQRMIQQNLTIDSKRSFASKPWEWPFMKKGILYWNSFYAANYKMGGKIIYFTGNHANWAIAFFIFFMPVVLLTNKSMLAKRMTNFKIPFTIELMFWTFVFNYLPLFFLSREMYLHNYLFSYYHALLISLYMLSLLGLKTIHIALTCSFAIYVRNLGLMGVKLCVKRCLFYNLGEICETL